MTRREQIEAKVSEIWEKFDMHSELYTMLVSMAEWADANPAKHDVQICTEINQKLERDNAVLVEALEEILELNSQDATMNAHHVAREALAKLKPHTEVK